MALLNCFSVRLRDQLTFPTPEAFIQHLQDNGVTVHASSLAAQVPLSCSSLERGEAGKEETVLGRLLILSSTDQSIRMKEFLRREDMNINTQQDGTGVTALMCSCVSGHLNPVNLLLKKGADPAISDSSGFNSLHCAVWGKNMKCVKAILSKSPFLISTVDQWGRSTLHLAALTGDTNVFRWLVKKQRGLLDARDSYGRTALHWGVLSKQLPVVKIILEQKEVVCGQPDTEGATPLHYAMLTGCVEIANFLLTEGANSTASDDKGLTPLHWASALGKTPLVQCLLQHSIANVTGTGDGDGLVSALSSGCQSALHIAASVGSEDICETLISANAEVCCKNDQGLTPLHMACRFGHTGCVRILLSHGAVVNTLTNTQWSGIHLASKHGHSGVVEELLVQGAEKDRPVGAVGNCPMHLAALHGHDNVLDALSRGGCSIEIRRQSDQRTPLHLSASRGHLSCCQLLVERGAVLTTMDSTTEGLSALDMALLQNHESCANYLISQGACTTGGQFHRAASTIQLWWKFCVHKRRLEVARQCAVLVLQQSLRQWLRRRRAGRLRRIRERRQHEAAQTIQNAWTGYSIRKKAFLESCTALRAKLDLERSATQLILTELHHQAARVQLPNTGPRVPLPPSPPFPPLSTHHIPVPPAPAVSHYLSPSRLLRSSVHTSAIFPTSSLVFHQKPRKPLLKPSHHVKLDSTSTSSTAPISVVGSLPATPPGVNSLIVTYGYRKKEHKSTLPVLPPLQLGKALVAPSTEFATTNTVIATTTTSTAATVSIVSTCTIAPCTSTTTDDNRLLNKVPLLHGNQDTWQRTQLPAVTSVDRLKSYPRSECKGKHSFKRETARSQKHTTHESQVDQEVLLHHAERYNKLHKVATLLQEARDAQREGREGSHSTGELKEQIRAALEEAVRLRADTESLHNRVCVQ